jgi:hypothetical protein
MFTAVPFETSYSYSYTVSIWSKVTVTLVVCHFPMAT